MQPFETWLKADLQAPVTVKRIDGNLFSGDNQGNLVGVTVTDSGEPVTLSGEVRGYFIRSDGNTVIMSGTIDGNKVTVVLPSACYTVVGQFSLVIKVGQVAVGACTGYVYQSNTDSTVDPEHVIPDIDQLLTRVEALEGRATTLEGDVSAQNNTINAIEDGLAIIATGNVHPAIANGQFVFVKGHSSLAEGLYRATASIGTNATLSTSNLTADGSGGLNALKGEVDSLNSNTTAVTRHTRKTSFSLSDLQAAVADQDLAKHGLKVGDETTINGHTYVIAGLNVMKGTQSYTCASNHVGLIVIPHTTHAWNASGKTNEGAGGREAGYFNCDLQYYLENDVMAMCNTDLGSAHLYAHGKLMGNDINETGYNRFGTATGCTSGWAWKENCYISALTEAQVYGGDHWSSSGYDTGEANTLLPVFSEYKHTEIFKNEYAWLRNVSSASRACCASGLGYANGAGVGDAFHVAGLILYH